MDIPVPDEEECFSCACDCDCCCLCELVDACLDADLRRILILPAPLSELSARVVFLLQPVPTERGRLEFFLLALPLPLASTAEAGEAERDDSISMEDASVPVADATVDSTWARALASSSALHSLALEDAILLVLGIMPIGGGVTALPNESDGENARDDDTDTDTPCLRSASGASVTGPSASATGVGRNSASLYDRVRR